MSESLRFVIAQTNFMVGDVEKNTENVITISQRAGDELNADLIIFPELTLVGYPPEDILLRRGLYARIEEALSKIQQQCSGMYIVLGFPHKKGKHIYNAVGVIYNQEILAIYHKQYLPNYSVFDEKRYFTAGNSATIVEIKGIKIGFCVCEDMWFTQPIQQACQQQAQLIISINASPFRNEKANEREKILRKRCLENNVPIIYAHWVGGQDELIFDGGSMVVDAKGQLVARAAYFQEECLTVDMLIKDNKITFAKSIIAPLLSEEATIYSALTLAVRDYVQKNNANSVLVGLSGGVDSALTITIAVDALGAENVEAIILPSRYTSMMSMEDIEKIVNNLQIKSTTISIEDTFETLLQSLAERFTDYSQDTTEENLQSRIRGVIMMAISNKTGKLVLTTGNKSENAVGYSTLYGDTAGAFNVLKDVPKTLVYRLINYRNKLQAVIPQRVISRPPSAELAHNQTDQDTLPDYETLDAIIKYTIEEDLPASEIIAKGFPATTVYKTLKMIDNNEFKRRQTPIGPRISKRAFGRDRRYPITSGFHAHLLKDWME